MTPADTVRFRQGSGRLCLDLVRTLRHRDTAEAVEELAEPSDLADWTRQFWPESPDAGPSLDTGPALASGSGPDPEAGSAADFAGPRVGGTDAPAVPSPDRALVASARELREAIAHLVDAARQGGGTAVDPDRVRSVNLAAAFATPVPRLEASGRLRWHADDPVRALLSLAAQDALELVVSPAATRVRMCAGPHCGALFLDNSRPGTRRWCSMGTCGNRAKKNTFRGRAVTAAAQD
jgi:predicted RNA-binding Zn ribbon-like protein